MLDIWQLSTNKPLTGTLSWNNKPPRNRLVSTTNLSYGMDITLFDFRCIPGTFHTFEVACHSASCSVDGTWWKGAREQILFIIIEYYILKLWYLAFYILQSQTLGVGVWAYQIVESSSFTASGLFDKKQLAIILSIFLFNTVIIYSALHWNTSWLQCFGWIEFEWNTKVVSPVLGISI